MTKNKAPIATLLNSNKKITRSKKVFFASLSMLCASSGLVIASDSTDCGINPFYKDHPLLCAKPELGVDFGFTQTQFKDSADKMFNRNQFPINFFFGFNVTERFGIEVGYGETRRKHKDVTLQPGESSPGADPVGNREYQLYDTTLSTSQPYVSLKYKHPIGEKLQLFGAIGIMAMKVNASWENTYDAHYPGGLPPAVYARRNYNIEIRKNIPVLRLGLYYPINKSLSLRFITTWMQTSKLEKHIPVRWATANPMTIKFKNSIQYSLGIAYLF